MYPHPLECFKKVQWLLLALPLLFTIGKACAAQDSTLITLQVTNTKIEDVFLKIERQTGLTFYYTTPILDGNQLISVSLNRSTIQNAMNKILEGKNVTWVKQDKSIILKSKSTNSKNENLSDTTVTIKGTVTTDEGQLLSGATVQIRGTTIGTMTNAQGQFILMKVPIRSSLIVTYTGYQMIQYNIKNEETFIVRLKRATTGLDEQVVIAYGTSSRRKLTGSIGRLTADEIDKQPISNPLQALQGRVAGVNINQNSGIPGGNFKVQIRGQNSLRNNFNNNGNNPLYIIDGVPFISGNLDILSVSGSLLYPLSSSAGASSLNAINPTDILSIEILKDGDATSIYGSRGSNGVILITTKRGKTGKMEVSGSFYTGYGTVAKRMELLNTSQYLEMRKERYKNDGVTVYPSNAHDLNGNWQQDKFTDWQKELIGGTSISTDAQASVTGGNDLMQYRFGGGFHKETTVFPGNFSDRRISTHFSLTNTSDNKKFRSQVSLNYSVGNTDLLIRDLTAAALTLPPNAPDMLDSKGNLKFEAGVTNILGGISNPYTYTKQPYDAKTKNLIGNGIFSYELSKNIIAKISFGYTNIIRKESNKNPGSANPPQLFIQGSSNVTAFGNSNQESWIIEPQINWKTSTKLGQFGVLVGSTFQKEDLSQVSQVASGFSSEYLMNNIGAVPSTNVTSGYSESTYKYSAIFTRLSYEFRNKYLVNVTARRDGSSRFGPGKQFGDFGSVGAAWIFSEEPFSNHSLPFLSYGKLRSSFGISGGDQIPNYGFLDTYTSLNSGQYNGVSTLSPARLYSSNFRWETTKKLEIALELGFIQDKILLTTAYYKNRSSNQLVGYNLPATAGFTTVQYNLDAVVQNTGFEIEMTTINLKSKNFIWNTSFNISIPRNKLVSYPNLATSSYASQYKIGEPLSIRRSYKFTGVNQQTGLYEVLDANSDGQYNLNDQIASINIGPRCFGGMNNGFRYKNLKIDLFIQFTQQNGYNYLFDYAAPGTSTGNQPVDVLGRWQKPGDIVTVQKYSSTGAVPFSRIKTSDIAFSDASFLRLKNISIIYDLPLQIRQRLKIKDVSVFVKGQNLFTITKYRGLDPETQGIYLPPLRVLTGGIQLTL